MTATATASDVWAQLAAPRPSTDELVKRDRYGRYQIPHPDTGAVRVWTRATTLAGSLADRYGLEQWDQRNIVLGIGARRDLYAQAVSCTPDDKQTLKGIVEQAKEAAKAKAGANQGTALHRLTERADSGERLVIPDPEIAADVDAYTAAMSAAGIRVARDPDTRQPWIERVVVVPGLDTGGSRVAGVAGTCDRVCLADGWPLPRIADLKTGKDVIAYGMTEIALQLAIYAHATHWFDPATGQLHPMPPVDRERAVVMHLPVGQGICTLIEVDIAAGWEAVQLAVAVRAWRKRKDLAEIIGSPVPPATAVAGPGEAAGEAAPTASGTSASPPAAATDPAVLAATASWLRGQANVALEYERRHGHCSDTPDEPASDERVAWLRHRIVNLIGGGYEPLLAAAWPEGVPTIADGGLTDGHVDLIVALCIAVEAHVEWPFAAGLDPALRRRPTADGPEHISGPLARAVEQMATASPPPTPLAEAQEHTAAARALLAQFDTEAEQRAVADCAMADGLMTAEKLDRLAAVAEQVADPIGAAWFHYGANVVEVRPSDSAVNAMVAGATGGDPKFATTGRSHALGRAKRLARQHGLPAPRSLAQAAESPLLAALVAAGRGAAEDTNTSNDGKA